MAPSSFEFSVKGVFAYSIHTRFLFRRNFPLKLKGISYRPPSVFYTTVLLIIVTVVERILLHRTEKGFVLYLHTKQNLTGSTAYTPPSRSYLHLVHDEVGSQDGVALVGVLSAVFLCPRGLARGRETHHHQHLAGGRSGSL